MNRIAISFLFFFGSVCAFADAGPSPDLQGVCKITLKNGQTVEGVILVGTGGYLSPDVQSYYNTNGFFLVFENGQRMPVLFNGEFKAIEPNKGRVRGSNAGENIPAGKVTQMFFLHDVTPGTSFDSYQTAITEEILPKETGTDLLLRREIIHRIDYELLDAIPVFTTIPEELYLRREHLSVKPVLIKITEIDTFELYREPPQEWLDRIARIEKAWIERHPDPTCETFPPFWYHSYVKHEGAAKMFKPWRF